jgi:hypothetical protein
MLTEEVPRVLIVGRLSKKLKGASKDAPFTSLSKEAPYTLTFSGAGRSRTARSHLASVAPCS